MTTKLKGSVKRVHDALIAAGYPADIVRVSDSARTSAGAAAEVGCEVAQIAKSLVFRADNSDRPVLVIACGTNRVDTDRIAHAVGEPISRADANFVRRRTGFAIGGVAPIGHREPPVTVIDADLRRFEVIWAAAGAPDAVFRLSPADLEAMTGGTVVEVKLD